MAQQKRAFYEQKKVSEGPIAYSLDQAMQYGDMPSSMIMSKFEETDTGPDEHEYEDYARRTLVDWGPDTNKFEHEEARGGVNASKGKLQLQYFGHRGSADVYMPEIFQDFGGPEDHDPRGINVDPDMRKLKAQEESRMRFIRFTPDGCEQITGGMRSEDKIIKDTQAVRKQMKNKLQVFSRQLDGRIEGVRLCPKKRSEITKTVIAQSYGDHLRGLTTPMRRSHIICKSILRDRREVRDEMAEADFAVAKYGQSRRRQSKSRATTTRDVAHDADSTESSSTMTVKSAGILMSDIVRGKRQALDAVKNSDMDFSASRATIAAKTAPFAADLTNILRSMTQDVEFKASQATQTGKTMSKRELEHLARIVTLNHSTPSHLMLNAETIFKSVKPGADLRSIRNEIITDSSAPEVTETLTSARAASKLRIKTGAARETTEDADRKESLRTVDYRHTVKQLASKLRSHSGEDYKKESRETASRAQDHRDVGAAGTEGLATIRFSDNASKERHARGLGSKYTQRYIDTDEKTQWIGQHSA